MNAFCASVNFDAFIVFRPLPSLGNDAENSSLERGRLVGADQMAYYDAIEIEVGGDCRVRVGSSHDGRALKRVLDVLRKR